MEIALGICIIVGCGCAAVCESYNARWLYWRQRLAEPSLYDVEIGQDQPLLRDERCVPQQPQRNVILPGLTNGVARDREDPG